MNDASHATRTDPLAAESLAELEGRVRSRLNGLVGDFRFSAVGHGLVLGGHARTYYAKQLAQQAVMELTPLPIVANEIEVS
jgi:hypothetical protein